MNDMKMGMRLLRYAYGIKISVVLSIVCAAGDLLCFGLELAGISLADGYFLLAISMIPAQLIFSLNMVNLILSASVRKKLQTSIPTAMTWYMMMGTYLVIILKKLVIAFVHPDRIGQICTQLVTLALIAAVIMAFTGIMYKFYAAIFIMCMFLAGAVQLLIHDIFHWNFLGQGKISLVLAALIGFVLITAGAAMEYGISLLVYKKPVSKMAMGAALRSQL